MTHIHPSAFWAFTELEASVFTSSSIIKFARVNAEKTTKPFTQLTQVHSQASRDPKVIMTGFKKGMACKIFKNLALQVELTRRP